MPEKYFGNYYQQRNNSKNVLPEITYAETSGFKLGKLAFTRMMACLSGSTFMQELTVESLLVEEDLFNVFPKKALNFILQSAPLPGLRCVTTCTLVYAAHQ